ncbi:MAG: DNA-binding response regulator [Omnitrophica bacterium RIFCSPHIGHO2_02_FULL_63_14]|nr:MAG: DNA-binding response regulator [Omnitrophica bacterium RIFCSPHIGHO2_02_FULL_63_14]
MAKPRILIVDDERNIVEALKYNLEKEGFRILIAFDGAEALKLAGREAIDAIVLDWMLPEIDGLEVCRLLRQEDRTKPIPILMLTVKSEETDKVLGLEMGVDDYMTKPFSQRELIARIRSLLRRATAPCSDAEIFQCADLKIDWERYLVFVGDHPVELSAKEFGVLKTLIEAKGRVLSRGRLLERVWDYASPSAMETRTVDFHISQLRKKLGHMAERIVTVKKAGYRFTMDE